MAKSTGSKGSTGKKATGHASGHPKHAPAAAANKLTFTPRFPASMAGGRTINLTYSGLKK